MATGTWPKSGLFGVDAGVGTDAVVVFTTPKAVGVLLDEFNENNGAAVGVELGEANTEGAAVEPVPERLKLKGAAPAVVAELLGVLAKLKEKFDGGAAGLAAGD